MNTDFYKIKPNKSLMQNSMWHWDKYPKLPVIPPNKSIEIANFNGPGIVKTVHLTLFVDQHEFTDITDHVYISIYYNNNKYPSLFALVNSFFCDSFEEKSINFCSTVMAKRPSRSLFCYIPMPFKEKIVIKLENRYTHSVEGYGYVTAEQLPSWENDNAYFHAKWLNKTVKITDDSIPLLDTQAKGHFFGCHMTTESICPHFKGNAGICEGNDEFYIDGDSEPNLEYLGTEDFFGFSWTWNNTWYDDYSGTTYLEQKDNLTRLACYRFLLNDPIRFSSSIKAQINYEHEINNPELNRARKDDSGYVKYGIVTYWYQNIPTDSFAMSDF